MGKSPFDKCLLLLLLLSGYESIESKKLWPNFSEGIFVHEVNVYRNPLPRNRAGSPVSEPLILNRDDDCSDPCVGMCL